ncbi:MAG: NYN domain-containing protein, partial [Betaproteobacteria bacterium]
MNHPERVMLLIDADNVSIDVMEQAIRLLLNQHGGLHVRRAYCTAESAVKHQAAFKRLAIKPMVNLAAGKNSTDIALAVDAIDLVLAERPDVVVIASSDSDFAPLVQRLREKGCVVRGIGQMGKTGDETQDVYDDYTVLEHRKSDAVPRAAASGTGAGAGAGAGAAAGAGA